MSKRILIVEDDEFNVKLLETMLKMGNGAYEVISTDKGSEALSLLRRREPRVDLLLLDLHLPEMSGEEILKEVKKIDHYADLPVIIISVDGLDENKYRHMGATDFVLKPFDPVILQEKINAAIA
jgi:CheY-like chemotaxis protein